MVDDLLALYLKATSFWLFLVEFDNAFGEIAVGILRPKALFVYHSHRYRYT